MLDFLGPLLSEFLDVRKIPFSQARRLSIDLTGMKFKCKSSYFAYQFVNHKRFLDRKGSSNSGFFTLLLSGYFDGWAIYAYYKSETLETENVNISWSSKLFDIW